MKAASAKDEKKARQEKASQRKTRPQSDDGRFRLLVSSIKDYAIFLLDPDGIIESWNTGAELLKGYRADEIIGQHFQRFYSEEDIARQHPQSELRIAKETGRYEEEGWRVRKDGSRFWANVVITRLEDENHKHIGFAKVTRNLTERKRAEEALRLSEERFRLMIESVRDYAIIMLDPNGFIVSWNEGAKRLNGYRAQEIIGRHFSAFYSDEEIKVGKCEYELKEAKTTGRFEDGGWRVRKDGSQFWANVVITPLRDDKGELHGFAKIQRDLTERKRAEDKLKMAHQSLENRVLERTQQLEKAIKSRDEFLSIASHELRTPLTSLQLQQQTLERHLAKHPNEGLTPAKAREMLAINHRQITQLSRLIEDMLDVSQIATGQLKLEVAECNLSEVAAKAIESFAAQFHSLGIPVKLDLEENLPILSDWQRLEQVMTNLLSNALRYGGGSAIEVQTRRLGPFAELRASDRGPGIHSADQERIFERFERAVPASEASGLGLGLYISRQIIEAHGGTIMVESAPQKGAAFVIHLPLKNAEKA